MDSIGAAFPFIDLTVNRPDKPVVGKSFSGPKGEAEADAWLNHHVLHACGVWEWSVQVNLVLDSGRVVSFDHRVSYGRTNGTLRQGAVRALTQRSLNQRLTAAERTQARRLAQSLSDKGFADAYPPGRNGPATATSPATFPTLVHHENPRS